MRGPGRARYIKIGGAAVLGEAAPRVHANGLDRYRGVAPFAVCTVGVFGWRALTGNDRNESGRAFTQQPLAAA